MYSLITKINHSVGIKDAIGIGRGLYRILSTIGPKETTRYSTPKYVENHIKNDQANIIQIKYSENLLKSLQQQPNTLSQHQTTPYIASSQSSQINAERSPPMKIQRKVQKVDIKLQIKQQMKDIPMEEEEHSKKQSTESKIVSGRFGRFFQYMKLGKSIVQMQVQAIVSRNLGSGKQQEIYQRGAKIITEQLCKMRGAPLKLAQLMSIQQDNLIPMSIRKAFEKARENAHIMPESEVESSMESYLGAQWKTKLASFQKKPFASASIGQVHRGLSLTGKELAIKLQYPGVEKSISSDINNIKMLLKLPGILPKGIFIDKILENTEKQLKQECNYERQSKMQEMYSKCLKKVMKSQSNRYKIPEIYHQISNRNILSSQLLKGIRLINFQNEKIPQIVRDQIGRLLMKLTFSEIFEMGLMQSDPNPSNFTYNIETGELNLFDFGATHVYPQTFLQHYCGIINASVQSNPSKIIEQSILAGFLTNEQNSIMMEKHVESILLIGEPLRYQGVYDFGNQKITERIYKTIPQMLKNRLKPPPEQIYSLHRKLSGAYLACIRLNSRVNCHRIFQELEQGYAISQFH